MEETGAIDQRKPLLTVEQQVEHLKSKGVTFELCSEEDAAEYLAERTYFFKVAAYRALFDKRIGGPRDGQYANLDFGHLRALASLDRDLRYALLPLTLDVEHAARTKLMRIATERDDEDGYALSRDYMASLNHNERRRREGEVGMMGNDLFCAERWGDREMVHEHYMLRQAKSVRNACAHSSDILNGIAAIDTRINADAAIMAALAEIGLSHRVRTAKMRNPRIRQIATLMYLHTELVTCESGKRRASANLAGLKERMRSTAELIPSSDVVQSSFAFLETLIDSWF